MPAPDLIAQGDRELSQRLLAELVVRQAVERIGKDQREESVRRQLLGTALRLTPEIAPDVNETIARCAKKLDLATGVEPYVYPGPYFNAASIRPESGSLLLIVSSSLLEAFELDELSFVVGHELGHFLFEHHRIPVSALLGGREPIGASLALQLFAWQRYSEISCDRAGVWCAGSLDPATRALFKLASGLRGDRVRVRLDAFQSQYRDLEAETTRTSSGDRPARPDWFSTHPFSPLRLAAAELFAASELMVPGGASRKDLEAKVQELMKLMEPSYLQEKTDVAEAMRRLLFAGGVAIATVSGTLEEKEIKELERLLGPGSLPPELKPDVIKRDLPSRLKSVKETVPPLRRAQVIRDLCVIARADGRVEEAEQKLLREIAREVEVDTALVSCTMEAGPRTH
jgi:Zn-dependent protease with chaperone function/tellurite resistance protein